MSKKAKPRGLFDREIMAAAAVDSVRKLNPRSLAKNPVIFVTEVVSAVVTVLFVRDLFASSNANNGSAFAGINGNTLWFNTTGGLAMLLGRFAYVVPVMAIAGSLAGKTF